jgi:hypothetical protein
LKNSTSGAQSNAPVNGFRFHISNGASFGEAIAKEAEVSRHPAKMEACAPNTTENPGVTPIGVLRSGGRLRAGSCGSPQLDRLFLAGRALQLTPHLYVYDSAPHRTTVGNSALPGYGERGWTMARIGEALGISKQAVSKLLST